MLQTELVLLQTHMGYGAAIVLVAVQKAYRYHVRELKGYRPSEQRIPRSEKGKGCLQSSLGMKK